MRGDCFLLLCSAGRNALYMLPERRSQQRQPSASHRCDIWRLSRRPFILSMPALPIHISPPPIPVPSAIAMTQSGAQSVACLCLFARPRQPHESSAPSPPLQPFNPPPNHKPRPCISLPCCHATPAHTSPGWVQRIPYTLQTTAGGRRVGWGVGAAFFPFCCRPD